MDLLIRGGQLVRTSGVEQCDIAIADGRIVEIAPELSARATAEIDARGLHVFPGVIDAHVHFNEPGRTEWEGVATGSAALAAGGGTCFFDMPLNSSPAVLDGEQFDRKLDACRASSVTDFALWGGLTPVNLDKLEELAERGVIGFKAFMSNSGIEEFPAVDDWSLYQGMKIAARLGLVVAVHAESDALAAGFAEQAKRAGRTTMAAYLASRPPVVELEAIRRAITLAQDTGCRLHIVHVSTWQGCAEVVEGRRTYRLDREDATVDVTCETCPHYLLLNGEDAVRIGPRAKCAPPLPDEESRRRLFAQLTSGGIDFVASDHSPSPASMKQSDDAFANWGGIAGVQSTLSAMLTLGTPLPQTAALTSENVASRFGLARKGKIEVAFDADLTLVDVNADYVLKQEHLLDRHKQSPYVGRCFKGIVKQTLVRGQTVFQNGRIVSPPIGRLLTREVE